ncbi:MAG: fibronectin type III domain-containing protein, partial [Bacteroidetes bacterium]|nr:fibronectin type III domain-containing protein [Bacteroidota bacterium]
MKKLYPLIGIVVFLLLPIQLFSQVNAVIGAGSQSGTSSNGATGDPGPIYKSTGTSDFLYSRHHYYYSQAELSAEGIVPGSIITKLAWYKDNNAASNAPHDFEVWLKNSTATQVPTAPQDWSNLTAGATQVYDKPTNVTSTVGWWEIEFDVPFVYTGGALEISVASDHSGATNPYATAGYSWKKDPLNNVTISYVGNSPSTVLGNNRTVRPQLQITYIDENADCHSPGNLTLDTLMPTTAEFSWTASPHVTGGYDWALMAPGDDPDVDTPIQSGNVTGTSLLVSNLTVLTDYVFYIQTDCGSDGVSIWRMVDFKTPPTCPGVDDVHVYNMTHQDAYVMWTETGPATSWNIEYGAPGFALGTGTLVSTNSNPHHLTGLAMATEYDLYIQSNCGPGDLSTWYGPVEFKTTIDCTAYALDITSTTAGSVCGAGSVTLSATASGTGNDIFWYDSISSTMPLGNGATFQTPSINTTTSYWVSEVVATGVTMPGIGQVVPSQSISTTTNGGLIFNTTQSFTLVDVEVFGTSATGGQLVVELRDINNSNATVATASATIPGGGSAASPIPVTVPLNFNVPPGDYRLVKAVSGPTFIYNSGTFPHPISNFGTITGGATLTGTSSLYYIFYNWTISTGEVECESPREEVIATVNNQADEEILTLPYTHTASTFDYDNNYSGAPGTDCGTTNSYLDGYDVVYKYTADDDYILNIELSGLTESHTAVFIYESCMDIGNTCYAEGSVNENIGTHSFQVAVEDTKDY